MPSHRIIIKARWAAPGGARPNWRGALALAALVATCVGAMPWASSLALAQPPLGAAAGATAPAGGETPKVTITQAKWPNWKGREVVLQGRITGYHAPSSDRAPHKLDMKDATGSSIRVAIWGNVWPQVPFNEKLQVPGTAGIPVTARVTIKEFKGDTEAHVLRPDDIKEGNVELPPASGPPITGGSGTGSRPVASAPPSAPIDWLSDLSAASAQSAQQRKPVLVFYDSPESDNSRFLAEKVFGDNAVRAKVRSGYVAARIDMRKDAETANKMQIFRGGTIVIYGLDGAAPRPLTNIRSSEELLRAL